MEGNTLEPVIGLYAIQVVSTVNRIDVSGWTVRNNRFDQAPLFMGATPPKPVREHRPGAGQLDDHLPVEPELVSQ